MKPDNAMRCSAALGGSELLVSQREEEELASVWEHLQHSRVMRTGACRGNSGSLHIPVMPGFCITCVCNKDSRGF